MDLKYGQRVIAEFEALIDTDVGLLNIVKSVFNNRAYIQDYILNGNAYFFKCLSLAREEENILKCILKDKVKDQSDSLLKEFMTNDTTYRDILNKSIKTSVFPLLEFYAKTPGVVETSVLCKNQMQVDYIHSISKDLNPILVSDFNINLSRYNAVFIKYFSDIEKYFVKNPIERVTVYMLNYRFNFETVDNRLIIKAVPLIMLGDANHVFTIEPYKDFQLPAEGSD